MSDDVSPERFDVVVVGGGQAGLAAGYHLAKRELSFVILDAHERIGDAWRRRWDGLRLFTAARYDGLPGMPFPASPSALPTKDEVGDYLQSYAIRNGLPVRNGIVVDGVSPAEAGDGFIVSASDQRFLAGQVVVATGAYHSPRVPPFAAELDSGIRQLHSSEYLNASQLLPGAVLVVGASNSGAEIAVTAARQHHVILAGRDTGKMPIRPGSGLARVFDLPFWFFINRIVKADTWIGRRALPSLRDHGGPLERIWPADLAAAGVERRTSMVSGVSHGMPRLDDGTTAKVTNVVWCTGFRPAFGWIRAPVRLEDGWPVHRRGVVADVPGLYFVGLPFLYTAASALIGGVGRDAAYIADQIARRASDHRVVPDPGATHRIADSQILR